MKKLLLIFSLLFSFSSYAADPIYTKIFSSKAVDGYDVVSYFTEGKPTKGDQQFHTEYQGATWLFSSKENLALFKQDPTKYAPQYGGYCAWAVGADNSLAPGNPKYWKIVDGKLYLNYDKSVQETWLTDVSGFITKANHNWPALIK
ncbi:YHS domain-containing (seleno)protein [Photobacterium damselae]|uniref:YHS domain-containing (seleno)protein n=1 Tax=Photobacterium damselae TaxID=38293 RepID=UPI001F2801AD|nr:YHS domain-containing (seleno)protein [Photobacterium damselae]UKA30175.1 YHS domain-containing protein [Photobacterium damselae subsp. damselae]